MVTAKRESYNMSVLTVALHRLAGKGRCPLEVGFGELARAIKRKKKKKRVKHFKPKLHFD